MFDILSMVFFIVVSVFSPGNRFDGCKNQNNHDISLATIYYIYICKYMNVLSVICCWNELLFICATTEIQCFGCHLVATRILMAFGILLICDCVLVAKRPREWQLKETHDSAYMQIHHCKVHPGKYYVVTPIRQKDGKSLSYWRLNPIHRAPSREAAADLPVIIRWMALLVPYRKNDEDPSTLSFVHRV